MRRWSRQFSNKTNPCDAECGVRNAESYSAPRTPHPASSEPSVSGWGLGSGRRAGKLRQRIAGVLKHSAGWGLVLAIAILGGQPAFAAEPEREPVILKVVAVNPSADKTQMVPVKIELPQEVTPKDVLDKGELDLDFDEARSMYYVHKDAVELAPKETRVFQVSVRDVWFIPQAQLDSLKEYTNLLMGRLAKSDYAATAKQLGDSIHERLQQIQTTQNDESLGRKARIGAYRYHLQTIEQVKEDLARMEKLLTFVGGPPVPEMLEESPLKADAPSRTTTWLVIFLIVIFLGLLGGQFFFTWHGRTRSASELAAVRQGALAGAKAGQAPVVNGVGSRPGAGPEQIKPRSPRMN